jgi:type IV secretion system protein VirD4
MLADQATTVVGRKIYLWISVQSLSQLETVYGRARSTVLRENMESQIYYRPADLQTAKYLEDRLGTRSAFARSTTLHNGAATSQGYQERPISLLASSDIAQMKDTQIIGFHRHYPPFRAKRMDWRRFPSLTQRQRIPAPSLSPLPPVERQPTTLWRRCEGTQRYIDPDSIGVDPDKLN